MTTDSPDVVARLRDIVTEMKEQARRWRYTQSVGLRASYAAGWAANMAGKIEVELARPRTPSPDARVRAKAIAERFFNEGYPSPCGGTARYTGLNKQTYEGLQADIAAELAKQDARIAELETEVNEALMLTECATSLKDMAALCIEGAHWRARAEKAEAEVARLTKERDDLQSANNEMARTMLQLEIENRGLRSRATSSEADHGREETDDIR